MRTLTSLFLLLNCLWLGLSAQAQNPPTWAAVQRIGGLLPPQHDEAIDAAGNTYVVATFQNSTTVGGTQLTSRGDLDAYVAKYSPAGALEWVQQIGSTSTERAAAVAVDAQGNVYVTGRYVQDVSLGNGLTLTWASSLAAKVYVVCYSPQGQPLWARQGNTGGNYGGGGSGLGLDAQGNVYVTGLFTGAIAFGTTRLTLPGGGLASGLFLAKYNSAGTLQWATLACDFLAIAGTLTYEEPTLAVSPNGAAYVLNVFSEQARFGGGAVLLTPRGQWDGLAAKFSPSGTREWVAQVGGTDIDELNDAVADAADNLYLSGYFRGTTASVGVGPALTTLTGVSFSNVYLVKLTPTGTVDWVKTYDTRTYPSYPWIGPLALDAAGNVCQAVHFTFDVTVLGTYRVTGNSNDVALFSFNPQGVLRWTQQISGASTEYCYAAGYDGRGDLRILGNSNSQPCRLGTLTLTASVVGDAFVARLTNTGVTTTRTAPAQALRLYPNPAHDAVYLAGLPAGTRVQLSDALGRVVRETTVAGPVPVRDLAPGLYTVRATDARGQSYHGRLRVE